MKEGTGRSVSREAGHTLLVGREVRRGGTGREGQGVLWPSVEQGTRYSWGGRWGGWGKA